MAEWQAPVPGPLCVRAVQVPRERGSLRLGLGSAPDQEPRESAGERLQRASEVDLLGLFRRAPTLETHLGALPGPLGALAVDLLRALRVLGKDDDALGPHLGEAAGHRQVFLALARAIHHLAGGKRREEGGMARQDTEA